MTTPIRKSPDEPAGSGHSLWCSGELRCAHERTITYCQSLYDCVEETDVVVIVTEWQQFRALDLERVRDLMACPVMVDLRNVPADVKKYGFAYTSVGRLPSQQPISLAGTPFSIAASA
jgi:UDP-glucose/GDP-mannose dehydrogenase family, UDP binding domain